MCGIIGFIDKQQDVVPSIIKGLKLLEYRGYDSAGIAYFWKDKLKIIKSEGRIENLETKLKDQNNNSSLCGIGHTRWATHGEPSVINSHPQVGGINQTNYAVVHNGIIENYKEIRDQLSKKGYKFKSETDTESIAHLIDYTVSNNKNMPLHKVVMKAINGVRGSFALGIVDANHPDKIIAAKRDNPLLIGIGKNRNMIASDITALVGQTKQYYVLDDNEVAIIDADNIKIYNALGEEIQKEIQTVTWDISKSEKSGFKHFMLKEIFEQPKAIEDTISPRIKNGKVALEISDKIANRLKKIESISIVACGSALHAGKVSKHLFENIAKIKCETEVASEFRYKNPLISQKDLCLVISQSGETADTLAALREAKKRGAFTIAIVNVVGSSIARDADLVLYTHAGAEIAVATTKAYTAQVALLYLLVIYLAKLRKTITDAKETQMLKDVMKLPLAVNEVLKQKTQLQKLATKYSDRHNVFFIGRGLDFEVALEGSLKLKEISYMHSEAYPAGEMKHGTISLIEKKTLVIALATQSNIFEKMMSNVREVASRGASVVLITNSKDKIDKKYCTDLIQISNFNETFNSLLANTILQLFSYYVAVERNCDIDKPRNLAKSVTVE